MQILLITYHLFNISRFTGALSNFGVAFTVIVFVCLGENDESQHQLPAPLQPWISEWDLRTKVRSNNILASKELLSR